MGYICSRMSYIFTDILNFESSFDLTDEQKKLMVDIKNIYGCALTFGKYTIDKLVDYKYVLDKTFTGDQKELYNDELSFEEKVEDNSKTLINDDSEWTMPDDSLYKDQPYISWKKGYNILYLYATGYRLLKQLHYISDDDQKEAVEGIINTTMASYYMAGRITNKMNEYNEQLKDTDFDDKFNDEHKYNIELSTKEYIKETLWNVK